MVRNVGGWETTFSSRLEASDQSICLSPGKSFLASRAHQRISVSVPASIVQHLWPDTTLYAFFSIAIHVEFKSAAVVSKWLAQMPLCIEAVGTETFGRMVIAWIDAFGKH